jgi:hypothetical protein
MGKIALSDSLLVLKSEALKGTTPLQKIRCKVKKMMNRRLQDSPLAVVTVEIVNFLYYNTTMQQKKNIRSK